MQYLDFDLEIGLSQERTYPMTVRSSAGEIRATMHFPFDKATLQDHLRDLQIALLRSGGLRRRILSPQEQTVKNFGQQLFDALFAGDVRSLYDQSRVKATHDGKGLRLRLHIQPPTLAFLPWEYLYDARHADYICLSRHTPLVRYLDFQQSVEPLTIALPLRILGMVASPNDQDSLDIEREQERMSTALAPLQTEGIVELSWLKGQTWRDLQRALQTGPWHVFHFIGHGSFDATIEEGVIALTNDQGKTHRLSATELSRLLINHGSLRLVLLNACQGAKGNQLDIFSSTAALLARRGIPAVLAMQEEITDIAAIELTRAFYEAIASGLTVDAAVAEARTAISIVVPNTLEWGTPVLYLRSADSLLFNLTEKPAKQPSQNHMPLSGLQKTKNEWVEQVIVHLKAGEYQDALEAFEQVIKLDPHDDFIYRQKGEALIDLEQYKEALEAFEQVINRSSAPDVWDSLPEELHPLGDSRADVRLAALQHIPGYLLKPEYEPKIRKGLDQMLVEEPDRRVREQIVTLLNENREWLAQRDTGRLASGERGVGLPGMVLVPAGLFIMGSPIGDKLRLSDEPEQFERNLDYDYKISKYPVTVGQYRAFINADGYHNSTYWTQAGWKWREQRIEPDYWGEDKWTSDDNLPIVGVSWYEAYAYTRWLAEVTGHDYKLPSETEWEKAARGGLQLPKNGKGSWRKNPNTARIWPWGNKQPDEQLLNFKRIVARSTPVGKFPQGVSPYHVFDMAGNVWEWCRSKWASPYVTQEDDDPETYAPRVVRGGSWNSVENYVRCAVRLKNHPHKTSEQIGFRVILLF